MFDIGFTELVLVSVIGLIVLGPERLPVAARTVGKWVGKVKKTIGGVQQQIEEELRIEELTRQSKASLGLENEADAAALASAKDHEVGDEEENIAESSSSNQINNQAQIDFLKAEAQAMEVPVQSKTPVQSKPFKAKQPIPSGTL